MDITTFFGYKNQFQFYVENNGANPITVRAIDLVNQADLVTQNIFTEIENSLPMVINGNSQVDVITNWYSLNQQDFTSDLTYSISFDIVDMTDFTTVIDTTAFDATYDIVNLNVSDITNQSILAKLNKHFMLGPSGTDTTIRSSGFTATGYPIIKFSDKLKFQLFILKYQPQFVIFNNPANQVNLIVGTFYYNNDTNAIECFFTEAEKSQIMGMVFNNIYMFYSDT